MAEYLHGEMKAAYDDPRVLRVPGEPLLPQGKVCGSMKEFTEFARRADNAQGVELFGEDELEKKKKHEWRSHRRGVLCALEVIIQ